MRTTLHSLVRAAAQQRPDAPALTFKTTTLSYGELWENARSVADGLRRAGQH